MTDNHGCGYVEGVSSCGMCGRGDEHWNVRDELPVWSCQSPAWQFERVCCAGQWNAPFYPENVCSRWQAPLQQMTDAYFQARDRIVELEAGIEELYGELDDADSLLRHSELAFEEIVKISQGFHDEIGELETRLDDSLNDREELAESLRLSEVGTSSIQNDFHELAKLSSSAAELRLEMQVEIINLGERAEASEANFNRMVDERDDAKEMWAQFEAAWNDAIEERDEARLSVTAADVLLAVAREERDESRTSAKQWYEYGKSLKIETEENRTDIVETENGAYFIKGKRLWENLLTHEWTTDPGNETDSVPPYRGRPNVCC